MHQDIFSLPEGQLVIQWPSRLSVESIDEIKEYLRLFERKVTRLNSRLSAEPPPRVESVAESILAEATAGQGK